MRKSILWLVVLGICGFSCKKDHSGKVTPPVKTYKVNISATGFTTILSHSANNKLKVNAAHTNSTPVEAGMTMLYYSVFDASGTQIHFIQQDSTTVNFGNISDNLPAGTYTIQIATGKGYLSYRSAQNSTDPPTLSQAQLSYKNATLEPFWRDTFLGRQQLTVSGDINQSITLNRIVAQLEIVLLDAIPDNVNNISVKIDADGRAYDIPAAKPAILAPMTVTRIIQTSEKNAPNFTMDYLVGAPLTGVKVTINSYDAAGALVTSVLVPDVSFQQNSKTILSGKLFGADNSFNVRLNPTEPSIVLPLSTKYEVNK